MKLLLCFTIFLSASLSAKPQRQVSNDSLPGGIHFEQGLSWTEALKKAKHENKFIFVDCYASWCVPCKKMDREVYTMSNVGDAYNAKFICIKMQMDATNDAEANHFAQLYHINAYPTFLYFDSAGRLVKEALGFTEPETFINFAVEALKLNENYYQLLEEFQKGKRDRAVMRSLANTALQVGDTTEAAQIAAIYIRGLKIPGSLTKEDIDFLKQFTKKSTDPGFDIFYKHSDSVDHIVSDDTYAQGVVVDIITNEMIAPELALIQGNNEPDWKSLENKIVGRYNKYYGDRAVMASRANWAGTHKDWGDWAKYYVLYEDRYGSKINNGIGTAYHLNSVAWAVFTYSDNRDVLSHAVAWSGRAVLQDPDPNLMDTYANLLYKMGKGKDAMQWELIAAKLSPDDKDIQTRLAKMKKGEATWPDKQ